METSSNMKIDKHTGFSKFSYIQVPHVAPFVGWLGVDHKNPEQVIEQVMQSRAELQAPLCLQFAAAFALCTVAQVPMRRNHHNSTLGEHQQVDVVGANGDGGPSYAFVSSRVLNQKK